MVQITLRLPEKIQEQLRYEAIRQGKSQNAVIAEVLSSHLEKNQVALEKIKQAVVSARGRGIRSQAESLKMAKTAAALDDTEGLGEIKVVRRKPRKQD